MRVVSALTKYQRYSMLASVASGAQTTLSSSLFLSHLDVFSNSTLKMYNYFGRDIVGQLGALAFVTTGVKYFNKPSKLSAHRIQNFQVAVVTAETIATMAPGGVLLPLMGVINVGKNIGWIGNGSLNTYCMQKLTTDNMPEVYAKTSVYNTVGYSIGMTIGIAMYGVCTTTPQLIIPLAISMGAVNLWASRGMLSVIPELAEADVSPKTPGTKVVSRNHRLIHVAAVMSLSVFGLTILRLTRKEPLLVELNNAMMDATEVAYFGADVDVLDAIRRSK